MKKNLQLYFGILMLSAIFFASCNDDDERPDLPTTAYIHYSVDDKQVAFTALANNVTSYLWDFGDGQTSTEANPVHIYEIGGYYSISLSVTGGTGEARDDVYLAISLPPFELLTGDPATGNGKKWKLSSSHAAGGDYFAYSDANFTVVDDTPKPLPDGIFSTEFGMGDIYDDEYTFFPDGTYIHDVKEDEATFSGYLYQQVANGGADIVNANGASYGLCIAKYTPDAEATFTFTEGTNFTTPSAFGSGGQITYSNVNMLEFSGTEFIGFHDMERRVILNSISDTRMQLIMFMQGSPSAIGYNTNALLLSFEVVN